MPEDIVRDLHLYISPRQMSKFVTELVQKGLETKREILAREFKEASQDEERNTEIKLWDTAMGDGLDETNEY